MSKDADHHTSWGEVHGDDAWHPDPPCRYIVEWFILLGRCLQGFNGPIPLTWAEIAAFVKSMKLEAKAWEAEALRRMSQSYVGWYNKTSQDRNIDPPLLPDDETLKRLQAANGRYMKQVIKGA